MISSPAVIYFLCLITSAVCAWLLMRAYWRSRARVLLWSGICFVLLAFNNMFLVIDLVVIPSTDLSLLRVVSSLSGVLTLIYGFIWELD